jgi:hypothetical protein
MNFAEQLKQLRTKGLRRPGRHSPEPASKGFGGREGGSKAEKGTKDGNSGRPNSVPASRNKVSEAREKDNASRQKSSKIVAGSKRKREDFKAGRPSSSEDERPTAASSRDPFFAKSKLVARQEDSDSEEGSEDDDSDEDSDASEDDNQRKGGKADGAKKAGKKMKEKKDKSRCAFALSLVSSGEST